MLGHDLWERRFGKDPTVLGRTLLLDGVPRAVVGILLLLACASVSNLLVTRATSRQREMALRAALRAGRRRLLSQLLAESLVLSLAGGSLALLLTYWALPVVRALPSSPLPRLSEVQVDGTVLFFAGTMTLLSVLIFGIAPALQGTRLDLMGSLKTGGRLVTLRTRRIRDGLVLGQLSLATMLLVGAGLLVASFVRMLAVDPGFDTERTLLVELTVPLERYPEMSPQTGTVYADILEAVQAVPGVAAAGATMASPISDNRPSNFVALPEEASTQDAFLQIGFRPVTPGFFRAMGIPLLAGRVFDDQEAQTVRASAQTGGAAQVPLVLSRSLAHRLWPGEAAVGKIVIWSNPGGSEMVVVGVVEDVRDLSSPRDPEPIAYLPHRLVAWPTMTLVVRSEADPTTVAEAVREAVWSVDPGIPVSDLQLTEETLEQAIAGPRLNTTLMAVSSLSALLLAAVGLYGLTAFSVARRSRELGVRIALGASKTSVLTLVLRRGLVLVLWGVFLGMAGALLLGRFLESILFGVETTHAVTYLQVGASLGLVTLLASLVPARRALEVDPVRALQAD